MNQRVVLAIVLSAIVIVVMQMFFATPPRPTFADSAFADSAALADTTRAANSKSDLEKTAMSDTQRTIAKDTAAMRGVGEYHTNDSTTVRGRRMTVWYGSQGAVPLRAALDDYDSREPDRMHLPVMLEPSRQMPLLQYVVEMPDTNLQLLAAHFTTAQPGDSLGRVSYSATLRGHEVQVEYSNPTSDSNRYLIHALFRVAGAPAGSKLFIQLPRTLVSAETDTVDDIRHLAFAYLARKDKVRNVEFAKLDSGETQAVAGSLEWVAVRNKYFLVAVISPDTAITGARFTGEARVNKLAPTASGSLQIPLVNGAAKFDLYLGPQEYERLRSLGYQLSEVNQYASWFHAVVQPFASIVTRVLLWMKGVTGLGYGWVIVIFGVAVRLILWPLNQSAMRTSIRMQRIQPEISDAQKKYKGNPKKQQEEIMKIYQAHEMTPFSPLMGCLPMLLPMPILFALYFVFLNTIEFRGVSFLWMHDLSAADPYYIIPVVMGVSMFALSWIGLRGTPPNSQTRMMSYMMPAVMTFMFLRFAAGLNLYYAVQNLASLPQQWLLAKERVGINGQKNSKAVQSPRSPGTG